MKDNKAKQILLPHSQSNVGPSTAKADINGDGLVDLFVGGASGQSAALFIMNADGTYSRMKSSIESDKMFEDTGACFFDAKTALQHTFFAVVG